MKFAFALLIIALVSAAATRATMTNSYIFGPGDNVNKTAQLHKYDDQGNHGGEIRSNVAVTANPTGSSVNGPASLDAAFIASTIKKDAFSATQVPGEITGAYFIARNGAVGDVTAWMGDVAAWGSRAFTAINESVNQQFSKEGAFVRRINIQTGVIDDGNRNYIGQYLACTGEACTDALRLAGNWTRGLNLLGSFPDGAILINGTPGITERKELRRSDGQRCSMVFMSGLLVGGTC